MQLIQFENLVEKFRPATIRRTKNSFFVEYYIRHPYTCKWMRKPIKLNYIKDAAERERYAYHLVNQINNKLYNGWNEYLEDSTPKVFISIHEALQKFTSVCFKNYSEASKKSYKSKIRSFENWIKETNREHLNINAINKKIAYEYMDYLLIQRDNGNKSYNNYKGCMSRIFNFLFKRGYVLQNPFQHIENLKPLPKMRKPLNNIHKNRLKKYLLFYEPNFYVVCLLLYSCKIRRTEIIKLRVKHINVIAGTVHVPAYDDNNKNIAKTCTARTVVIPNSVLHYFEDMNYNNYPDDAFLVGRNYIPNLQPIKKADTLTEKFGKIAKLLKFEPNITLYSLKDTGLIDDLVNNIPAIAARDQAGHHDISETNKYLTVIPQTLEIVRKKAQDM